MQRFFSCVNLPFSARIGRSSAFLLPIEVEENAGKTRGAAEKFEMHMVGSLSLAWRQSYLEERR